MEYIKISFLFMLLFIFLSTVLEEYDEKLDNLQPKVDTVIVTDTLWCYFEAGCPK